MRWDGGTRGEVRQACSGAILAWLVAALGCAGARADTIRGFVRDSTGHPVAHADFDVFSLDGTKLPNDDSSGPDGFYHIEIAAGRYDLACQPPIGSGLAPQLQRGVPLAGLSHLDWTVRPSVRVLGRVRGADGAALAGADLTFDRTSDGARQPVLGNKTNLFGSFAAYIEAGEYRLTAYPPAGIDLAPAWIPRLVLPTADTLALELGPAVHLSGVVRDAGGAPVMAAKLTFDRMDNGERVPTWGHYTAADGSFRVGVSPGTYSVLVHPPRGAHLAARRIGPLDLAADGDTDIILERASIVSGLVLDRQQRPVVGARWSARDEVTDTVVPTPDDNSDYDGRFTFALAPSTYRLTLYPPAGLGLDTLAFDPVRVSGDTVLSIVYEDPARAALLRLGPLGNPTHRRAMLRLVLPHDGETRVEVFDVAGRLARLLAIGWMPRGVHDLRWDGNLGYGAQARTGIYFVRATCAGQTVVTRFIMLP